MNKMKHLFTQNEIRLKCHLNIGAIYLQIN